MKILVVDKVKGQYRGFLEMEDSYVEFSFEIDSGKLELHQPFYPKKDYPSYMIFAQRYINFNPDSNFLREPVVIEQLTEKEIERAWKICETLGVHLD